MNQKGSDNPRKRIDNRIRWILLGVVAIILRILFGLTPELAEGFYARGIFVAIRWIIDYSIALIPLPLIYLLIVWLSLWIYRRIRRRKRMKDHTMLRKLKNTLLTIGGALGAVTFLFFFLWGYNYSRLPIEKMLDFYAEPLNYDEVKLEAQTAAEDVIHARSLLPVMINNEFSRELLPEDLEKEMRMNLQRILDDMGYPTPGRVRARKLWPNSLLIKLGITGIYFPFTGESYINGNLIAADLPFTIAHEMSHGYGFGDEGTANFLAYLACKSSTDPGIKYTGLLLYYRYASRELYRASKEDYEKLAESLPPGMKKDLENISEYYLRHRTFFHAVGKKLNDVYLKSQGVEEGFQSYDRVVRLVVGYKHSNWN